MNEWKKYKSSGDLLAERCDNLLLSDFTRCSEEVFRIADICLHVLHTPESTVTQVNESQIILQCLKTNFLKGKNHA